MTTVEIFSQGEEVISGHTVDTNAAWLSQCMLAMGFTVTRHTAVGDKLDDLVSLLAEISLRADICICSGGLGPTLDDLTAEAVSQAFAKPLQFDQTAFQQILAYYQRRKRDMPESNRKQAMLPKGCERLDNEWGTAPGFALHYQNCWFAFVPGVPLEMRHMFEDKIQPWLKAHYHLPARRLISLKTIGIGESDIQQQLQTMLLPDGVQLSFCAGVEEVQTKLQFSAGFPEKHIQTLTDQAAELIGDFVYAIDGLAGQSAGLAEVVAELLNKNQQTLAVIETISHGQLLAKCREFFCLSEALYALDLAKIYSRLGLEPVAEPLLQTAIGFAKALQKQSAADFVLVQVFDQHQEQKKLTDRSQSISVLNVLATPEGIIQKTSSISGHLLRKQNQAALLALDFLRRYLQNKQL